MAAQAPEPERALAARDDEDEEGLSPLEARQVLERTFPKLTARVRDRLARAWHLTLARLFPLGGSSEGNRLELYFDGDRAFLAMLEAIEGATTRVWLETYIFEPDALGLKVLDALARAAARGAHVILLYDAFGSPNLGPSHTRALVEAGGRAVAFNPLFAFRRRLPLVTRDHRKILIVDEIGFAGGMNVSREYAGTQLGNARFRDTHARLEGPSVRHLAAVFTGSFKEATGDELRLFPAPAAREDGSFVQVLGSNARRRRRHIQRAMRQTVGRCLSRCYLTTPYFVPPKRLIHALIFAKRRGVDVRVLTAGDSDVPIVRRASLHLAGQLLKRGVRIYELFGHTLHAKTATLDGIYASVGSFNLDLWSYRRNLEVNVTVLDPDLARDLEAQFEEDLTHAKEIDYESWKARGLFARFVDWLAYQMMRI